MTSSRNLSTWQQAGFTPFTLCRARQLKRFAALCGVLVIAGCATLPKPVPVQEGEADQVRREFTTMLNSQRQCPAALDADVTVTLDNLLWSGTVSGYLRAMAPASLRFEGVNPLGLTEAILAVDGERFTYLSVRNQQVYSGPLTAAVLSRYAPDGLATSMSYYWLLGRIQPGSLGIADVGLDGNDQGYWLELQYATTGKQVMILFDPKQHLVKRHLVLSTHRSIAAELAYEYSRPKPAGTEQSPPQGGTEQSPRPTTAGIEQNPPQGGTEQSQAGSQAAPCELPTRITISKPGNGIMTLAFTKRYPTPALDSTPFQITPPVEYTRTEVQ